MYNPLDFFLYFFQKFDEGNVFLTTGNHAYKISTKGKPLSVWLSESVTGDISVCGGNINMYGVTLDEDGFILYADVTSNSAELGWQALLE